VVAAVRRHATRHLLGACPKIAASTSQRSYGLIGTAGNGGEVAPLVAKLKSSNTIQMIRRDQSMRVTFLTAVGLALMSGAQASDTSAGEVCIRCTAPEQTYRCDVLGGDAPADVYRIGLYCAARIAEDDGHAACAAVRKEPHCPGSTRSYVYDARLPAPWLPAPDQHAEHEGAAVSAQDRDGPPDTVVELTRETARRTEEGLERAADETAQTTRSVGKRVQDAAEGAVNAVDRAAQNTIRCIGSWFDDC